MKNSIFFILKYTALLLFCFFLLPEKSNAQSGTPADKTKVNIRLKARSYGDSIVLRWGQTNHQGWELLNRYGYRLERVVLDGKTNVPESSDYELVGGKLFKPWTLDEWDKNGVARDTQAIIAAWALHGKRQPTEGLDFIKSLKVQQDEDINRFSYAMFAADLSPFAAKGLGLRYTDKNVQKGKKYIYRLSVPSDSLISYHVDTTMYILAIEHEYVPLKPQTPTISPGDGFLHIVWQNLNNYTAFDIEKSEDGIFFKKINKNPYVMIYDSPDADRKEISYLDTTVVNYQRHFYRIRGYDAFGDKSQHSDAVEGQAVDQTPPEMPLLTYAENTTALAVELHWKVEDASDIDGFIVSRAPTFNGPYDPMHKEILPASQREFIHPNAAEFEQNFYKISSIDKAGNLMHGIPHYVQIKNQAPPAAPIGLKAEVDTNGVMLVTWHPNPELDMKGYLLAFANQIDHEFINLTEKLIRDTFFRDTINLNVLTEKMYLKLKAIDVHYSAGDFTEIIEVIKPDIVPPVSPVIENYAVRDSGIFIKWIPSSSEDAVEHFLERETEKGAIVKLANFTNKETSFLDKTPIAGEMYEYRVVAVDDAGLRSPPSFPVKLRGRSTKGGKTVENFRVIPDGSKGVVKLSWNYDSPNETLFMIYKASGDRGLKMYKSFTGNSREFIDKKVKKGEAYRYSIRTAVKGGGKSVLSKEVGVSL